MINVENYVQGQVAKHRRLFTRFSDFQKHMEEGKLTKRQLASYFQAIDIYEDSSSKDDTKGRLENEYIASAYDDEIPPYLVKYKRIPRDILLGIGIDTICDTFTGQWYQISYTSFLKMPEENQKRLVIEREYYDEKKPHYVTCPVLIVGYTTERYGPDWPIRIRVRFFNTNGRVQEMTVRMGRLDPLTDKQLTMWVYRHKFSLMRKHIRRWVEHIRYKPGSQGYKRSYESFKNNLNH